MTNHTGGERADIDKTNWFGSVLNETVNAILFCKIKIYGRYKRLFKRDKDRCINSDNKKDYGGYFLIAIAVLILYLISLRYSYLFHELKVPRGDPFSYTTGFFVLLDQLRTNFWAAFFSIFRSGNWYWLINSMIAILSPVLFKEPYSIMLINFVLFGLATASIFRLARCLGYNVTASFCLSIIFWLFPSNYGFQHTVSLMQMQLDMAFLAVVIIAVSNTIIYAIGAGNTRNAFLAGFAIGVAVWGRGNSLPYVLICVCCPVIIIAWKTLKPGGGNQKKKSMLNFVMFFAIILFMTTLFFGANWRALAGYYSVHSTVLKAQSKINFPVILTCLKNIPGRFWCYNGSSLLATIIFHIIVIASLIVTCTRNKVIKLYNNNILKIIAITGAVIFYGILFFNLVLFNDPNFYALHPYALMLAGLTFCGFSLLASLVSASKDSFRVKKNSILPVVGILIVLYGGRLTAKQTPLDVDVSAATPREVEAFACGLDKFLGRRSIAILWYEMYNGAIINYYRIKNDLPMIPFYTNKFFKDLWAPPYSPKNKENIIRGIKKTFEEADFIIIPEYSDSYFKYEPYPFYHRSDDLANYLNFPESPKFVVRKILHEPGNIRLLLLQKARDALEDGEIMFEPLKLPYGTSALSDKSEYTFVPSDKADTSIQNVRINVSDRTGTHDYGRAFDHSIAPDSFWEVGGEYPFWISIGYKKGTKITKYFIQAGEYTTRLPTEWQFQGSANGKNWDILDNRIVQTKWRINEKKECSVSRPGKYRFYRLYFTGGAEPTILRIYEIGLKAEN